MTPGHLKAEAENPFTFRDERLFVLWQFSSRSPPFHTSSFRDRPQQSPPPLFARLDWTKMSILALTALIGASVYMTSLVSARSMHFRCAGLFSI